MAEMENQKVVERIYRAFGQGDIPSILGVLAEDIDWLFVGKREDVPFAGQRHGHQEVIDFFSTVGQSIEVQEFGPREMMAFDDKVLALGHERVRVRANGRVFETDWAHLFTIQNGKVVRVREFYDTGTMAAAFRGG